MNIALLPDRLTKGNGPPTAFKTVGQPAFPVVQTMHTDRETSNPWKLDEVILKEKVQGTFWKSKVCRKTRICALGSELELKKTILTRLVSHRMAFCQRDQFPQTRQDQTPGNVRELLHTTSSTPRATEARAAGCTKAKADAEN